MEYKRIIIIPLGGLGNRFSNNGYKLPKPLINVLGKPIIFWLLDNLKFETNDLILIHYNNILCNYRFEELLTHNYNLNFKFIKLQNDTRGACETIKIALENININYDIPIISIDGDNFYTYDVLKNFNNKNTIYYFNDESESNIYSYIKLNDNNVIDILEKNKISKNACCGIYGFESYKKLLYYINCIINKNIRNNNEFYISTVIKYMLENNEIFTCCKINNEDYHCLGTPFLVRLFVNNYPNISCINKILKIKSKRYCFDLDNTLVSYPKIKDDYTTVEPIQKNIDFLKYLKSFNHTIIIYTARRMKTHKGNIGKVLCDIGKITFDTLEKFDIPYDEIYFGKPYADFYIDDLAINCFENLEKSTGFYKSKIQPRHFNSIDYKNINTITKRGNDLSGEIHYYKNIPENVKDIFEYLINCDIQNK